MTRPDPHGNARARVTRRRRHHRLNAPLRDHSRARRRVGRAAAEERRGRARDPSASCDGSRDLGPGRAAQDPGSKPANRQADEPARRVEANRRIEIGGEQLERTLGDHQYRNGRVRVAASQGGIDAHTFDDRPSGSASSAPAVSALCVREGDGCPPFGSSGVLGGTDVEREDHPRSWCSALWQCAIHRPGCVTSSSRSRTSRW